MDILLKISPEITIKSDYVRKSLVKRLEQNIRTGLKNFLKKEDFILIRKFDRLELEVPEAYMRPLEEQEKIFDVLSFTPGLAFFWERKIFPLQNFEAMGKKVLEIVGKKFINKTFRASVKRNGNHAFTSIQLEKYLGGAIAQNIDGSKVKLKNFDEELNIAVKDDTFSILTSKHMGLGGMPIGAEQRIVSLISGGYDSGVSSYLMMRKGCPTDFLFFNLGGYDHTQGVKQVSKYLAEKISNGYNPNMIVVPFESVMRELIEKTEGRYRTILLKRCMMRAAELIAQDFRHAAIITGESIAQVSSQTITNLNVIEQSLDTTPLFRPLLTHSKLEIIDISRHIGTDTFAAQMPEFCGVISKKPATAAKLEPVLDEEEKLSADLITDAVANKSVEKISDMQLSQDGKIFSTSIIQPNEIIIDLRQPEEIKNGAAPFSENKILEIPFYDINEKFSTLDQTATYVFFCSKGVMSKSHSQDLFQQGFKNIKIFKKSASTCTIEE